MEGLGQHLYNLVDDRRWRVVPVLVGHCQLIVLLHGGVQKRLVDLLAHLDLVCKHKLFMRKEAAALENSDSKMLS